MILTTQAYGLYFVAISLGFCLNLVARLFARAWFGRG